jgi:uncharacterized protein (TIGR03086 family)
LEQLMEQQMDVVDSLEQTFTHAHAVIAGVRADQHGDKTPCAEWTVRDLLEHMIGVVAGFGAAAAGKPRTPFELAADPAAQFHDAAGPALAAWRTPGVLDRVLDAGPGPMPGRVVAGINLLDTATHTWDLATATGQPAELPEAVAVAAMDASQSIVSPEIRSGRFGPVLTVPDDASATRRLVAFLGRTG